MAQKEFKKQHFEKPINYNVFFGYYQQNMSWAVKNSKTVDTLTVKHSSTTRVTLIFTPSPFLDIPYHSWCPATLPLCFPPVPDYFHINSDPLGHQLGFVEKEAKNCVKEGKNISNSQD